jgi:hypothetical protein
MRTGSGGALFHIKELKSCPCTGTLSPNALYHTFFVGSTWGTPGNVFVGDLDEVSVWSRALSPGELNYLLGNPVKP